MTKIGDKYMNVTYPFEYTEFLIPSSDYKVLVRRDGSGYVENMGRNSVEVIYEPLSDEDHDTFYTLKDKLAESNSNKKLYEAAGMKAVEENRELRAKLEALEAENIRLADERFHYKTLANNQAVEAHRLRVEYDTTTTKLFKQMDDLKAKADRLEKLYTDEVANCDEWAVKAQTLEAVLSIKAMNIDMAELYKVYELAGVESACPLVECCVEGEPTEEVISYNCHNKCGQPAENCCFCTYYR